MPDDDDKGRKTLAPPDPVMGPEPPTKPRPPSRRTFKLDSTSAFERPDPSAVVSRRGRDSLLGLAESAPPPSEHADALDLVDQAVRAEVPPPAQSSKRDLDDPVRDMRERFSLGDYSGALVVADALLDEDPTHAEALRCADNCRQVLEQMYTTRIGPLDRVPYVAVAAEQLRWLNLDHRAGFVLSHIDGSCSLEQILDVSGMPKLDALRILFELMQQRVISFR